MVVVEEVVDLFHEAEVVPHLVEEGVDQVGHDRVVLVLLWVDLLLVVHHPWEGPEAEIPWVEQRQVPSRRVGPFVSVEVQYPPYHLEEVPTW